MCVASCPSSSPRNPPLYAFWAATLLLLTPTFARGRVAVYLASRARFMRIAQAIHIWTPSIFVQGYREKIKLIDIIGKNKHVAFLCRVSTRSDMGVKHLEILYTFCARLDTFLSINRNEVKKYYIIFFPQWIDINALYSRKVRGLSAVKSTRMS